MDTHSLTSVKGLDMYKVLLLDSEGELLLPVDDIDARVGKLLRV